MDPRLLKVRSNAALFLMVCVTMALIVFTKPEVRNADAAITTGETSKFKIESLTASTSNRTALEVVSYTGDDRGGIALSDTKVVLRGDANLGVFNKADLSSPSSTAVNAAHDAVVSDLKSMKMYAFDFVGSTGNFTKLMELNQSTGAVPASPTTITLSTSIPYSGGELYSGYGRVVYRNSNGTVYDVDLPSGTVYNRGSVSLSATSTENNIRAWGVAEFFDSELWLTVGLSSSIVRYRVSDGIQQTVLSTIGMSDLASFIVDPVSQMWYFHYEGYASAFQFGYDETLGLAPAVITTTPSVTISPASTVTNQNALSVNVAFSEAVTGLTVSDFTLGGTASGWSVSSLTANSGTSYTLALSQAGSADGSLTVRLLANAVTWTAGNVTIPEADVVSAAVTIDHTSPTVSISSSPSSPAAGMTQTFGLTFSESVSGISSGDFSNTGTSVGCVMTPSATSGTSINVVVTQCQEGTLQLRLSENSVVDAASNTGPVSPLQSSSITLQASALTVTAATRSINFGGSWTDAYTTSGMIGGDTISSTSYSYSGTTTLGTSYGPSSTKPTAGGTYSITPTVVFSGSNTNRYAVTYVAAPLTIARIAQSTLTVTSTSATYGSELTLASTGGSGSGSVSYVVTSGTCSISNAQLIVGNAGSACVVTATKAADDNYLAISSAGTTISIAKTTQASLSLVDTTAIYGQNMTLAVSGGSGTGAVSFSVVSGTCSISGTTLSPGNAGSSCVVKATKATDTNYLERSTSNTTITISKASQTGLNITSPTTFITGSNLSLFATGGQSTGSLSWSLTSGTCVLANAILTSSRGGVSCVVEVTRAGDSNHNSSSVSETISVSKIAQSLTFRSIPPTLPVVGGSYTVQVDSDASLAPTISIANSSSSVCSISAGVVTFQSVGTCLVSASQSGNDTYASVAASQSIIVGTVVTTTVPSSVAPDTGGVTSGSTSTIPQRDVAAVASTSSTTSTTSTTTTTTTLPADPSNPVLGPDGLAPELEVGEATAIVRGKRVKIQTSTENGQLTMTLPGNVVMRIGTTSTASGNAQIGSDGVLRMYGDSSVNVGISGLVPKTTFTVFMFSKPIELGRGETSDAGTIDRVVTVPKNVETGNHTLQINGVGKGSEVVSVSMGFEVIERESNTRIAASAILLAIALALLGGRPIFKRRRRA